MERSETGLTLQLTTDNRLIIHYLQIAADDRNKGVGSNYANLLLAWARFARVASVDVPQAKGSSRWDSHWAGYYFWPSRGWRGTVDVRSRRALEIRSLSPFERRALDQLMKNDWRVESLFPQYKQFWRDHGGPLRDLVYPIES